MGRVPRETRKLYKPKCCQKNIAVTHYRGLGNVQCDVRTKTVNCIDI